MKVGAESKKKTTVAIVLFTIAVMAIIYELWPASGLAPTPAANSQVKGGSGPVFSKLDPSLRLDLLKGSEDVTYSGSGRDIFHSAAAPPEIPNPENPIKGQDQTKPSQPQPVVKTNPPIPLKFYGFASANNKKQIFLSQGEDVFVAKEGDIVKGRYKVLRVNNNNVEIQDVLANYSQQIPLTLPNS